MKKIHLELPQDVRAIVLQEQAEIKSKKNLSQYSQQQTIYNIVREFKKFKETPTQVT